MQNLKDGKFLKPRFDCIIIITNSFRLCSAADSLKNLKMNSCLGHCRHFIASKQSQDSHLTVIRQLSGICLAVVIYCAVYETKSLLSLVYMYKYLPPKTCK